MGEEQLTEIPGVGDKTAVKIMEAARDLFEEVEIEVPEGMELPTALKAPEAAESKSATEAPSAAEETVAPAAESQAEPDQLPEDPKIEGGE